MINVQHFYPHEFQWRVWDSQSFETYWNATAITRVVIASFGPFLKYRQLLFILWLFLWLQALLWLWWEKKSYYPCQPFAMRHTVHSDAKSQFSSKNSDSKKFDVELKIVENFRNLNVWNFKLTNNFNGFVSLCNNATRIASQLKEMYEMTVDKGRQKIRCIIPLSLLSLLS